MARFEVPAGVGAPWLKNIGDIPAMLDYFEGTMWEKCEEAAREYPDFIAYDFMGKKTKYSVFAENVHLCARALKAIGIRTGDRVTVCLPNCP